MAELTEGMVRYLTEIDHHDHEAIVALDAESGEGVGVARYVRSSTALLLGTNAEVLDLLGQLAPVQIIDREHGTVEVEIPLREVGLAPALGKLLRVIARNDTAVPLAGRPSVQIG